MAVRIRIRIGPTAHHRSASPFELRRPPLVVLLFVPLIPCRNLCARNLEAIAQYAYERTRTRIESFERSDAWKNTKELVRTSHIVYKQDTDVFRVVYSFEYAFTACARC